MVRTKLTLTEYAETWIETQEGRLRPGTLERYRDCLRLHVLPVLGGRKLSSITVDDVAALLGYRPARKSARHADPPDGKDERVLLLLADQV